jgi:hypothetical protein
MPAALHAYRRLPQQRGERPAAGGITKADGGMARWLLAQVTIKVLRKDTLNHGAGLPRRLALTGSAGGPPLFLTGPLPRPHAGGRRAPR